MINVAILGSTGSIGQSALAVVGAHPDRLRVVALAAGENIARFVEQVAACTPDAIAMSTPRALADACAELAGRGVTHPPAALSGADGLIAVATHPDADVVLFASSGTAALDAVLAAIDAGKTIALANKEVLVMAGAIVMQAARRRGVPVLPVDSEHNAIHQCLHGRSPSDVRRLILTASGGPFRDVPESALQQVTPDEACAHPNWSMGRKISVDSATMMNKGLEVIEAHWLFGAAPEQIEVVIHPQSVVHSMVEYADGSVIAQLGNPDMRTPIAQALAFPDRIDAGVEPLDLARIGQLGFEQPDLERFPALRLAYQALRAGGTAPAVLNAANEVAVAAFLERRLSFLGMTAVIEETLGSTALAPLATLQDVLAADAAARAHADQIVHRSYSNAA